MQELNKICNEEIQSSSSISSPITSDQLKEEEARLNDHRQQALYFSSRHIKTSGADGFFQSIDTGKNLAEATHQFAKLQSQAMQLSASSEHHTCQAEQNEQHIQQSSFSMYAFDIKTLFI